MADTTQIKAMKIDSLLFSLPRWRTKRHIREKVRSFDSFLMRDKLAQQQRIRFAPRRWGFKTRRGQIHMFFFHILFFPLLSKLIWIPKFSYFHFRGESEDETHHRPSCWKRRNWQKFQIAKSNEDWISISINRRGASMHSLLNVTYLEYLWNKKPSTDDFHTVE